MKHKRQNGLSFFFFFALYNVKDMMLTMTVIKCPWIVEVSNIGQTEKSHVQYKQNQSAHLKNQKDDSAAGMPCIQGWKRAHTATISTNLDQAVLQCHKPKMNCCIL